MPRVLHTTEMEFDLDKALEEVPIHVEDPPLHTPPPSTTLDLGELPPVQHTTLEHRTKFRPKPRRTKPSRPAVRLHFIHVFNY